MPRPARNVSRLAERWQIALDHRPQRGSSGQQLGTGVGSSLEFQDRRQYQVGDDVRHLDWRAFARTDQMLVRRYREEVRPRLELLLDASRSMAVDPAKGQLAVDLAALLAACARAQEYEVALVELADRAEVVPAERFASEGSALGGRRPLADCLRESRWILRPGSLRIVVSDFLSPCDASELIRGLRARAGQLTLVQVLGAEDVAPPLGATQRLVDAETGEALEVEIDAVARDRYLERLRRLGQDLARECARAGGHLVEVTSADDLESACRGPLSERRVLEPA